MADLVELNFEGKSVGLTALNLNKGTIQMKVDPRSYERNYMQLRKEA